jgi:hypothetical protein
MKIKDFKKLEKKINSYDFNQNYKNINTIMLLLSYFGNVTSIFLAYFFVSKVLQSAISDNMIVVFMVSIILLSGLELMKRDIFDKFSIQSLKDGGVTKSVLPLMALSALLIAGSFYSSINGAKEYSEKSKKIEAVAKDSIQYYTDSVNILYSGKINEVELEIKDYKNTLKNKDSEQTKLSNSLSSRGFLTPQERERSNVLSEEKKNLDNKIALAEEKINNIKKERDDIIGSYGNDVMSDTNSKKEENNKNSFLFVMLSTLIELIILGGIYFGEYYKFRSYKEFRQKIEKDPNYQKWLLYDQMLDIMYTEDTKMNQKLPPSKVIINMCKVSDIIVLPKDVSDFTKVLVSLGIIKASGSVKYINKTKDTAIDILRNHFKIE